MGLLGNIFTKKEDDSKNISCRLNVDFHSHLIPRIDDGSQSFEESVLIIKGLTDLGVKKIITTPHVQSDTYTNTPENINSGLDSLNKVVKDNGIDVEIIASAEYLLDGGFLPRIESKELLAFGEEKYILVELSYIEPFAAMFDVIFELQVSGYKVILAHPERYQYAHSVKEWYEKFKNRGVLFQINGMSLTGYYGKNIKTMAEKLIDNRWVELIGSDLHKSHQVETYKSVFKTPYCLKLYESGMLINDTLI